MTWLHGIVVFTTATAEASMSDLKKHPTSEETPPRITQDTEGREPRIVEGSQTVLPFSVGLCASMHAYVRVAWLL